MRIVSFDCQIMQYFEGKSFACTNKLTYNYVKITYSQIKLCIPICKYFSDISLNNTRFRNKYLVQYYFPNINIH